MKIGEKEFTLKYNNRALFKIEKALNKSVIKIFQDNEELEKLNTIYTIVWAGIVEDITFDEFADIASMDDLSKELPSIIKEIGESFETGVKKK